MPPPEIHPESKDELRRREYDLRMAVSRLRRGLSQEMDLSALEQHVKELQQLEVELSAVEQALTHETASDPKSGLVVDTAQETGLLGPETTGLDVKVHLKMAHVPTGMYHLLSKDDQPLVACEVRNAQNDGQRRVRMISFIAGYSAQAVDTIELRPHQTYKFQQLPTLYPERLRRLNELTRATLDIMVENLDGKIELHKTEPIWLLARNTAPLSIQDPSTGERIDMTRYLGAYVTPNEPSIMEFLRLAAARHPDGRLTGYQDDVETQVKAIFDALKLDAQITYVDSLVAFDPREGASSQRVRLPRQSLHEKQANCVDGALLFASLLEAISLNPAIVAVPGHAFVAWETQPQSDKWRYLETTKIGNSAFEVARDFGDRRAKIYEDLLQTKGDPRQFRRWGMRQLRTEFGITPME